MKRENSDGANRPAPLLIGVENVATLAGVCSRTVWRLVSDPRSRFPRPLKLGRRTLWRVNEIHDFIENAPGAH